MSRVAAGWLDDGAPWPQESIFLTVVDHGGPNTIFDAATRVEHFHFRQYERLQPAHNAIEAYQWGTAYQVKYGAIVMHLFLSGCYVLVHRCPPAGYILLVISIAYMYRTEARAYRPIMESFNPPTQSLSDRRMKGGGQRQRAVVCVQPPRLAVH